MLPQRRLRDVDSAGDTAAPAAIIDVVFLLLIYFAVVYETPELLAQLPVDLAGHSRETPATSPIRIDVHRDNYTMDRATLSIRELQDALRRIAEASTNQVVIVDVDPDSDHHRLIDLMDAWGNSFRYQIVGKRVRVTSPGRDGKFDTSDDLRNR